jgi:phosphopantothenoylcysteine decarboxylase
MANVLLGVTGSVAAILTPELHRRLKHAGHWVKVAASQASLYFFDPKDLDGRDGRRNPEVVVLDEDEWPGRDQGRRWQRGDPVLHIELRRWADLLLIAPLDANTLAKLACGLADNCLTCIWRAWDPARPVVLAPAMNTLMWDHPLTGSHLLSIAGRLGVGPTATTSRDDSPDAAVEWINQARAGLRIVRPQTKQLACGDVGAGALAPLDEIIAAVQSLLPASP